jgi:predicted metalloprotease
LSTNIAEASAHHKNSLEEETVRWQGGRQSGNVEDRRGVGMPVIGGGIAAVVLAIVAMLFGVDPRVILQGGGDPSAQTAPAANGAPDEMRAFVATVLGSTEDVWAQLFKQRGATYVPPKLVLFTGAVQSACGFAQAAVGPFYCAQDRKVYLDLSFFQDLKQRFGAPGDFAQAYVIAHEVGHHVQQLLGITQEAERLSARMGNEGANGTSVRMELQADCFAGIWGSQAEAQRNILEPGDVEEALNAAAAIGDDRLQKRTQGEVVPESFTHGTSQQRVRWFKAGFETGDIRNCDTFGVQQP